MGTSLDEVMEIADSHANSGNDAEAIQAYMEALEIDPENATAWYCLGVLYSRTNSLDKAVESFQKSNKIFPNHPPTLANIAYLISERDASEYSENEDTHPPSIAEESNLNSLSGDGEITVERVFVESRQIEDLDSENDSSQEANYSTTPGGFEEAKTLSNSGDHSGAVALWKGLLEESPNSPEVWRGLGEALRSAGYDDRAEQCFRRADAIEYEAPTVVDIVEKHEQEQDDALILAVEEAKATTSETPSRGDLDDAVGWYNMGINLLGEGKNDEALSSFEKAIGGCPPSEIELKVKAQNGRGNALYNSGRFSESVVAYHTAIGMDPHSVSGRTLFNMGSSYAAVEMFDDAIKCFTQALERGLDKEEAELCEKQISRCRLLSREQAKRQARS